MTRNTESHNGSTVPDAALPDAVTDLLARDAHTIAANQKLRFFPLVVTAAEGCVLTEAGGRQLLDLSASWSANGVGHAHPKVVAAIAHAAAQAPGASILSQVNPYAVALAEKLLAAVPGSGDRRVLLGHAGTDANAAALAAARASTGRAAVLAFHGGYHGGFGDSQSVSGVFVDAGLPADPDAVLLPYPGLRPRNRDVDATASAATVLAAVERELASKRFAAVIVEPLQSDGGVIVPPEGFLAQLCTIAHNYGTLLICDEVKVGLGRTGNFSAFEAEGFSPDLVTLGKSLGGGLPLSAVIGPAAVLDLAPASMLLTTAGNPISAAAGIAVLNVLQEEQLHRRAALAGERFLKLLRELQNGGAKNTTSTAILDVRGRGLSIGIELQDPTDSADSANAQFTHRVVYRLWELGAVCYSVRENVIELTPPLSITDQQIDHAVRLIDQAIFDVLGGAVSEVELAPYLGW